MAKEQRERICDWADCQEFLGLSPQHNEHCKGWRWHLYMADTHKRAEAVREEARKIIAARRAREDAAEQNEETV